MSLNKNLVFEKAIDQLSQYDEVIRFLVSQLNQKNCFLLHGDLAAGKTTLVNLFAQRFEINDVSSPTFAIHQQYKNQKIQIDHFDLYRLESEAEIETSGLWEVFSQKQYCVFIEWSSRLNYLDLPLDCHLLQIEMTKKSESGREVRIFKLAP